jgi:hypothetical protein
MRSHHPLLAARLGRRVLAVVAMALAAASCSSDSGERANAIRPFSEVQDGRMSFEADPNDPSSGIFRVTTTEPMICAIVWGTDSGYGRFNNSQSMNGTGIIDHDVVLPNVEPGVEYRYIVQGTTADGTLYRSEEATFVIEPAPENGASGRDADLGENLATGAAVLEASSVFSPSFGAEQAVDGDLRTEWSSRGDGDGAFLVIDLGEQVEIGRVEFVTRSMSDGSSITETFTISVDGGAPLGPFNAATPAARRLVEINVTGRVLRFEVASSTGGNVGAVEIGAYGSVSS